jgi:hypothetical protein
MPETATMSVVIKGIEPETKVVVEAKPATSAPGSTLVSPQKRRLTDEEVTQRLGAAACPLLAFTELCKFNSDTLGRDLESDKLTYYHSTEEPPMPLPSYLERIMRYSECGPEGILIGLRLVGRCHMRKDVTLTRLSAHRLMIAAMTLGVKAHADRFRSNRTVAKAGGLQLRELNGLEIAMFREVGYRAVVTAEELRYLQAQSARALNFFRQGDHYAATWLAENAITGDPADELPDPPLRREDPHASPQLASSGSVSIRSDPMTPEDDLCHPDTPYQAASSVTSFQLSAGQSLTAAAPRIRDQTNEDREADPMEIDGPDTVTLPCFVDFSGPLPQLVAHRRSSRGLRRPFADWGASVRSTTSEAADAIRFRSRAVHVWQGLALTECSAAHDAQLQCDTPLTLPEQVAIPEVLPNAKT